jgi:hypothetical protein
LFVLTLKGNASEWFYSLLSQTITSWDVLENLFVEKYFPRKDPYSLFLKLVEIHMNDKETVKNFTFRFMKVLHEIPQEMFPNDFIIFSFYENAFPVNMRFLLKKEGKCSWKELMQQAQVIEENIHQRGVDILKFPICFQDNGEKDLEEKSNEICENLFTSDYVPEAENENPNVSIQEKYHLPHAPLEGNCDLSYVNLRVMLTMSLRIFDEPPLDAHEYFIQYGHGENVAVGSQWPQLVYTKMKEECQHGINKSDDKIYHFTLNFQVVDFSSEVEFNEEEVFQHIKRKGEFTTRGWVVYFIFEDNEIVGEQQI